MIAIDRTRRPRRHRPSGVNEAGFVMTEFVLAIAVLLLPVTLLVSVFPTWSERKELAVVAAREAARTYVITRDAAAAQLVVDEIADNYALEGSSMRLELNGNPSTPGGEITAIVHVGVPATVIPIMNADADAFMISNQHTEVVDLYRSL